MDLLLANVVVVGQSSALQLLTQGWLLREGIITDKDLDQPFTVSTEFVQFNSSVLSIIAQKATVSFEPKVEESARQELLARIIPKILEKIKCEPTQMGINFTYAKDYKTDAPTDTAKLFFVKNNPFYKKEFNTPDAIFGAYLSKDLENGFRIKLSIFPAQFPAGEKIAHRLGFQFNYHRDFTNKETALNDIGNALKLSGKLREESALWINEIFSELK